MAATMPLTVIPLNETEREYVLQVSPYATARAVKAMIEMKTGINPTHFDLEVGGSILNDVLTLDVQHVVGAPTVRMKSNKTGISATDALSPFDGRKPVEAWKQTDNVVRDRLVVLRNKPGVDGMSLEDHAEYMEALKKESRFVTKNIVTGMSAIDQRWGVKTNKNHLPTSEMYKLIGR